VKFYTVVKHNSLDPKAKLMVSHFSMPREVSFNDAVRESGIDTSGGIVFEGKHLPLMPEELEFKS